HVAGNQRNRFLRDRFGCVGSARVLDTGLLMGLIRLLVSTLDALERNAASAHYLALARVDARRSGPPSNRPCRGLDRRFCFVVGRLLRRGRGGLLLRELRLFGRRFLRLRGGL